VRERTPPQIRTSSLVAYRPLKHVFGCLGPSKGHNLLTTGHWGCWELIVSNMLALPYSFVPPQHVQKTFLPKLQNIGLPAWNSITAQSCGDAGQTHLVHSHTRISREVKVIVGILGMIKSAASHLTIYLSVNQILWILIAYLGDYDGDFIGYREWHKVWTHAMAAIFIDLKNRLEKFCGICCQTTDRLTCATRSEQVKWNISLRKSIPPGTQIGSCMALINSTVPMTFW